MQKYADPQAAATAATKALLAAYPDEAKICGLGSRRLAAFKEMDFPKVPISDRMELLEEDSFTSKKTGSEP